VGDIENRRCHLTVRKRWTSAAAAADATTAIGHFIIDLLCM
jgi:hypothetical protein